MLWRIWTLLVSVLRWMTPRPGFLLPMAVKGAAAGDRGKNGISGPNGSNWKEQKAEFLRNPSLRQSKQFQQQRQKQRQKDQQQQHRRKFFDFGFGSRSPSPSPHSPSPNEKGKGDAKPSNIYGKWRKRQPSTNAFVFVTPPLPPPTVTVQDFSNVPLPLSLVASTPDVEGALPPVRPPRPPSGPVPTVVVTPSTPMVHVTDFGVAGGGLGATGVQPHYQTQSRPSTRDSPDREPQHYRSSSGRHLSPEWLSQSPPPSSPAASSLTLALPTASESVASSHDGHARKSPVSSHSLGTGVGGHPNQAPARTNFSKPIPSPLAASTARHDSLPESDFGYETLSRGRESPLVFASSRFSVSSPSTPASSRPTSFTGVQYHQDPSVSWDHNRNAGPARQDAAPPLPLPHSSSDVIDSYVNFNSRTGSYTTSTPTKDGRTVGHDDGRGNKIGLGIHDPEDTNANTTFLSTVSEAGSFTTPPRSEAPVTRRVHLPDDDLDLLPYPEVFDLDMYFSNWRSSFHDHDHDHAQTSRLSLCVLRNAKAEDIQRMQILAQRQELQSRQNESVKDFMSFSPSPPPLHGYLGLIAADSVSEMNVPLGGSGMRGDDEHLFREKENRAPASARAQWSLRTKRFGHLEGEGMLGPTSHSRNHARSRSLATSFGSQIHENEGASGRQVEGEVRRDAYRPAASRPILRQVGNTVSSTAASETNSKKGSSLANPGSDTRPSIPTTSTSPASSATRSSLTSRVLIPPVPAPPVHARLPSSSLSSKNPRPPRPHLQITVPGLSQRVINRKKESELSPIKEAFHPPSLAILTPPPPSPTSPHSCPLTDSAHEEHHQGRRPRPPTLPIVIVSHHRFGSISDYGDGNDTDLEDHEGLYYRHHSESSEDEDEQDKVDGGGGPRHSYDSGGFKSRIPGHSRNGRRRESRQTRSRWSTSSLAYMDEEHGRQFLSFRSATALALLKHKLDFFTLCSWTQLNTSFSLSIFVLINA
ncbi:hypothetical protein CVT26_001804 [Gymnopilus dilepis]|uniref:Uncharacterized protein n=1 Tax=Gymnopilus dilepis TaxID=231916 RepID=A0A409Y3Y9_9AGAR|nr:hypothetical protein CVT26_001804 [Gymnopilus dilepis]